MPDITVNDGAKSTAVSFINRVGILSGPQALHGSSPSKSEVTPSVDITTGLILIWQLGKGAFTFFGKN